MTSTFSPLRALLQLRTPARPDALELPYFQRERPCSLLIDEIEELWASIAERDDFGPFERKVDDIREMGRAIGLAHAVS